MQGLRTGITGFIAKGLMVLIIISFAVWGVGDVITNSHSDTVAKIGDERVTRQELELALREQVQRMQQTFGGQISPEQLQGLNLEPMVLQQLAQEKLITQWLKDKNIRLGDEQIISIIAKNHNFQDEQGRFSKERFMQLLQYNQMSETQYFNEIEKEITGSFAFDMLTSTPIVPSNLVHAFIAQREETRTAEYVVVPENKYAVTSQPSEAALTAFYEKQENQVRAPESRDVTYLVFTEEQVAGEVKISEEQLRSAYEEHIAQAASAPQKELQQMFFEDEAKAEQAMAELKSGKDFAAVAKEVAGQDAKEVSLGVVHQDELLEDIAPQVFALKDGETSPVLKSDLGWHIYKVMASRKADVPSFEKLKPELLSELKPAAAADALYQLSAQVEDALGAGESVNDVANKFKLQSGKISDLRAEEKKRGEAKLSDAAWESLAQLAYATEANRVSPVTLSGDEKTYLAVRVDSISPSRTKALDEVRANVVRAWQKEEGAARARAAADKIAEAVGQGKSLKEAASAAGFNVQQSGTLKRYEEKTWQDFSPEIIDAIFSDANAATRVFADEKRGGFVIAAARDIKHGKEPGAEAITKLEPQIKSAVANATGEAFLSKLREDYPIKSYLKAAQ